MITIAKCANIHEALMLKMALESNDIAAFIPNEHTATNLGGADFPHLGGVRVQVDNSDVEAAKAIISDQDKS